MMRTVFLLALLAGAVKQAEATLLTITLITNPSWGTVVCPTVGSTSYELSTSTGMVNVLSGTGFSFGDGGYGVYQINAAPLLPVSYSVSIAAFSGTGVAVTQAYVNGTTSTGSGALSLSGTYLLDVGGILTVSAGASSGIHTATVTVTVNYL